MTGPPLRPRLVFINRFYWPDELATAQLLTDLAEGLAGRGWSVDVIASHDGRTTTPIRESRRGVDIVRVRATRRGGLRIAGKALDYLTFSFAGRRALRHLVRAGDCLVAMTDPPTLAPLAAAAARRAGARLVHWVQDIHPEVGLALSRNRVLPLLAIPWMRRRDVAWHSAQACVAVSRDISELLVDHGVPPERLTVIPNWAPGGALNPVPSSENNLPHEWGLTGQFLVTYSGNLGRVHALEPVLAAAAVLRGERNLTFLFIGAGPQRPALETAARRQGLENVRFLPPQPRARLAESLSAGDLHLVTLRAGCERFVFPSKIYGIAAVGRPVIFVGPASCALAAVIREQGMGLCLAPNDPPGLAAAIRELRADAPRCAAMGAAAKRWSQATGGVFAALTAWENLLAAGGRQATPACREGFRPAMMDPSP